MRISAAVAVLALTVAFVAACGGSALDPVASAATKTGSGSMHVTMDSSVKTGTVGIALTGEGDFDNAAHTGSLHLTFAGGGLSGAMDEVISKLVLYIRSDLFSAGLPHGKTWLKIDLQKAGKSLGIDFSALGNSDPTQVLAQLEKTGSVTKIGEENIGVATTRYRARVDLSKVPNGAKLERLTHATYGPTDVWIDSDGFVRRMRMSYGARIAGGAPSQTTITMNFSDFGEPVSVSVPSASQTFDATNESIPGIRD